MTVTEHPPGRTVVGLDLGHTTTVAAEHWLAKLPPVPGLVACTHLVHGHRPRVVITLAGIDVSLLPAGTDFVDEPEDDGAAKTAAASHVARRAGRAVIYPGVETLTGTLTIADLLAHSAIDRIQIIGSSATTDLPPDTLVDTRNFVRPQWVRGQLTLIATPAPAGRIAPFEVPNPTPCCGDHP